MKLRINVDGKAYEVEVEIIEEDQPHLRTAQPSVQSASASPVTTRTAPSPATNHIPTDENKVLYSPISGVVVRVPVQVGQSVKEGDTLLVLEAMKMETAITSKCDGKIRKINANEGDAVHVKELLVEFE